MLRIVNSNRSGSACYIYNMTPADIQEFRKRRLQEAIDACFDGKKINLARHLKNRHGEALKDASYIGHLLKPMGEKGARPIDEDRVREIEGLRFELRDWFRLPDQRPHQHITRSSDPQKRPSFTSNELAGLSTASVQNDRKQSMIPINPQPPVVVALNWEQLMETILKEGLTVLGAGLWVEVRDDSMVPEFNPGDLVRLERLDGYTYKAGDRVLMREAGGDLLLREYRAITSKTFEAVPLNSTYGTLHSASHGLELLAKVTRLTKMYR